MSLTRFKLKATFTIHARNSWEKARELLGIDFHTLEKALEQLALSREVVIEESRVYPAQMANMENSVRLKNKGSAFVSSFSSHDQSGCSVDVDRNTHRNDPFARAAERPWKPFWTTKC